MSFPRNDNTDSRDSFSDYYVLNVEIKDFNVLIDGNFFFDFPVKNEEETYEKNIEMSNNNDYTTGNLLDFAYFKENYKLIAIDLSKQTKLKDPQQINFIGKLDKDNGTRMFFIIEKSEENTFNFSQNSTTIINIMETQKIINLLNDSDNENSKFATKKWYIVDNESKSNYSHHNPIKFLTKSIESSLCDYSDAYILVTGNINVTGGDANTKVAFKNCAPFKDCRIEIYYTFDYADFLNITMPMYNLIEYSDNYSDTSGSLWNFKRDEIIGNINLTNNSSSSL